jgi:amino acid transporter
MLRRLFQKCLTTLDLTSLGVGSCVGTGMYLVAGMVARNYAGPGVVFSFIIAAVASIFSGKYGALNFMFRPTLLLSKETGIHCMGSLLARSRA